MPRPARLLRGCRLAPHHRSGGGSGRDTEAAARGQCARGPEAVRRAGPEPGPGHPRQLIGDLQFGPKAPLPAPLGISRACHRGCASPIPTTFFMPASTPASSNAKERSYTEKCCQKALSTIRQCLYMAKESPVQGLPKGAVTAGDPGTPRSLPRPPLAAAAVPRECKQMPPATRRKRPARPDCLS